MEGNRKLCLVEDDLIMGESLSMRFQLEGVEHDWFKAAEEARAGLERHDYAALLSDINLPGESGADLFRSLIEQGITPPPTVFITGYGTIEQAVELIHHGACDYVTKPFELDDLLERLRALSPSLFSGDDGSELQTVLGISTEMREVEALCERVAGHASSILITGESGVGKEHIAQLIHHLAGSEAERPFVALNCAAISEGLLEAELFGYEKGAFTGANKEYRGVFEQAVGGTLFLDEIGEMAPGVQSKLLRVIQERRVRRLGSEKSLGVDVRLICATNRDLVQMIGTGEFREDLFYRINGFHIKVPALRNRRSDILWFSRKFLDEWSAQNDRNMRLLASGEQWLKSRSWPGNLRQLRHTIERACILSTGDLIGREEFEHAEGVSGEVADDQLYTGTDLKEFLATQEQMLICEVLKSHDWKINETATALGISRKNLWEKMRKYQITPPDNP